MTVTEMRILIKRCYKSEAWKRKVNMMTDEQVIAVYWSFVARGKFNKKKDEPKKETPKETKVEQLNLFDIPKETKKKKKRPKVIAVDFDGTLCENRWPGIGEPNYVLIDYLKNRQKAGDKIVLWTCRSGARLGEAINWCLEKHKLFFDAINENIPEYVKEFGGDSRKIFAHEYIDDRMNITFKLPFRKEINDGN